MLIILYIGINLPLAIWMLRSFFQEIPRELIEAAEIDGASLSSQLRSIILPIAAPGIAATALLCVIFAWNEFFYAVQLNFAGALDDAASGSRRTSDARRLPGEALGRFGARLHPRRARRMGRPEAHDPWPCHGRDQMRKD